MAGSIMPLACSISCRAFDDPPAPPAQRATTIRRTVRCVGMIFHVNPETVEEADQRHAPGGMRAFRQAPHVACPNYRLLWEVAHR